MNYSSNVDSRSNPDHVSNVSGHNVPLDAVMSHSYAFGGNNPVLIARRHTS